MRTTNRTLTPAACLAVLLAVAGCVDPNAQAPVATAPAPAAPESVTVLFPKGGARLDKDANAQLDQAARLFREGKPAVMFITGHSDSKGTEYNNLLLSARRARAVKDGLVARGLPADHMRLVAFGEAPPLDAKETSPSDNRRVDITWR